MCNTEKLGGAGDEANTSLLDMFKIQAFIIYLCIHNWEMLSYTGDFFFLEPVSTLTLTKVRSKGNICLLRFRRILILTS